MTSVTVVPVTVLRNSDRNCISVDTLPDEMNDMKIRDDEVRFIIFFIPISLISYSDLGEKSIAFQPRYVHETSVLMSTLQETEPAVVDGNGTEIGHIIVTTVGGGNGQPKQVTFHCVKKFCCLVDPF